MAGVVQDAAGEEAAGPGQWVDELTEKGKATRCGALRSLTHALRVGGLEVVEGHLETLEQNLRGVLRKAKDEELEAACELVQALAACATPEEAGNLVATLAPTLRAAVAAKLGSAVSTDAPAEHAEWQLTALATLCFFCSDEEQEQELVGALEQCEAYMAGFAADEPKVAALRGWGLLATRQSPAWVAANASRMAAILQPLLAHECLDVKVEAGENLAMLVASVQNAGSGGDNASGAGKVSGDRAEQGIVVEDANAFVLPAAAAAATAEAATAEAKAAADAAAAAAAEAGATVEVSTDAEEDAWLDDVVASMEELSYETERGRSKRDLKEQRARFRAIVASVREGEAPEERLQVDKTVIPISSWEEVKRLECAKDALKEGFAGQVKRNAALHEALNLHEKGLDEHFFGGELGGMDGRTFYRRDKAGAQERQAARDKREAVKGDFMTNA